MAVDVLSFNEIKRQTNDLKVTSGFNSAQGALNAACRALIAAVPVNTTQALSIQRDLIATPWNCATWACVPTLATVQSGLSVCDTSACFNQGACCLFTVPSGATRVRFQIWGAGAASGGSVCCGGSMHGGTGAYASVILPAVAGCQYTLCSGCAWFAGQAHVPAGTNITTTGNGCASFVQGFGLNNFCAEGGDASHYCWRMRATQCADGACVSPTPGQGSLTTNHPCFCAGASYYCTNGGINGFGSARNQNLCHVTSCRTFYGCTSINDTFIFGIPGMYNISVTCGNNYGCKTSAPVFGFAASSCYAFSWTSGTCGGSCCITSGTARCCVTNFGPAVPGSGGLATHAMSGNFTCGTIGAMGMVCVQWGS